GPQDEFILQLYYDLLDFSKDAAGGHIGNLLIKLTNRLFLSVEDRSNGYLCALMADDILANHPTLETLSPLEVVVTQLEQLQHTKRGKKGFSELLTRHPSQFVQVMS